MKKLGIVLLFLACLAVLYFFRGDIVRFAREPVVTDVSRAVQDVVSRLPLRETGKKILAPPPLRVDQEVQDALLTRSGTITRTNAERVANGLPQLEENALLDAAALAKAEDILARQYFEHISPLGVGPSELAQDAGYQFILVGENLALGNFKDDADLVGAWMESPGHRENILNEKYSEIGVAVVQGMYEGKKAWVAVQEFGLPLSACPSVDQTRRAMIDMSEAQLTYLKIQLDGLKAELDGDMHWRAYREKADAYNILAGQYNDLLEKTRWLIGEYNNEVRAFNACVQAV